MSFKPLLAAPVDLEQLRFPVLASPKLDGVRAIVRGGVVLSRKLLPIPSPTVQAQFAHLEGLDGELTLGPPTEPDVFVRTSAACRAHHGKHELLTFWVFDHADEDYADDDFEVRLAQATSIAFEAMARGVRMVPHARLSSLEELSAYEDLTVGEGYEGVMLRDPQGRYKHGRSTAKEGILLKMKRFTDAEATVIGFEPLMRNHNEDVRDALGHAKRSKNRGGLVADELLGKLVCELNELGEDGSPIEFGIGSGFTEQERRDLWAERGSLIGRIARFRYQATGTVSAPRCPIFAGFRQDWDI